MNDSKTGRFTKGSHWRTPKSHWDREWLYNQYTLLKRSASDIAIEMECKENNILYWLDKHKIPRRSISETRAVKYWGLKGEANGMYGRTGKNNPRWRGGITSERQAFYSSIEWSKAVRIVWQRDKATCRRCGQKKKNTKMRFHIHHIVSFENRALRTLPENLVLLCTNCHRFVHSRKNTTKQFIKENALEL